MCQELGFKSKTTAATLLLILLVFLLVGCNSNDTQGDSAAGSQVISAEEFYTPTPDIVANSPDIQATQAALRATEIDQALQRIESNITPMP